MVTRRDLPMSVALLADNKRQAEVSLELTGL